jgi:hypothetical protein
VAKTSSKWEVRKRETKVEKEGIKEREGRERAERAGGRGKRVKKSERKQAWQRKRVIKRHDLIKGWYRQRSGICIV